MSSGTQNTIMGANGILPYEMMTKSLVLNIKRHAEPSKPNYESQGIDMQKKSKF